MVKLSARVREAVKGKSLIDLAFLNMVLSIMAFYDFRIVAVILQGIFLLCVLAEMLKHKRMLFTNQYHKMCVIWYAVFFIWAAASFVWAEHKSTYLRMLVSIAQVSAIGVSISIYIDSKKRLNYAFFVLTLAAYVFCMRFLLAAPPALWGQQMRIGKTLTFGGNRGAVFLSFVSLIHVYFTLLYKRWWLYLPAVFFMFIAMLFGTRVVLVFIFCGAFFLILARSKTRRQFANQTIILAIVAMVTLVVIMNVDVLRSTMGRRIADVGATLEYREQLSVHDQAVTEAEMLSTIDNDGIDGFGVLPDAQSLPDIKRRASSTNTRLDLIGMGLNTFLAAPVQGVGLDGYRFISAPYFTYAHSNQVELLATLGIVGFGLYYWFQAYLVLNAWQRRERALHYQFVFAFLLALFMADVFLMTYYSERDHVFMGIIVGIMALNIPYGHERFPMANE